MTADANCSRARSRTLQDDLLRGPAADRPDARSAPRPARPRAKRAPIEAGGSSPAVELRVTRTRWLAPSMRLASKGVVVTRRPDLGLGGPPGR